MSTSIPPVPIQAIVRSSLSTHRVHSATQRLSRRGQWRLLKGVLVVNDVVMLGVAFWLAYVIRFGLQSPIFQADAVPSISYYRLIVLGLVPVWLSIYAINGLYDRTKLLGGTQEYALVFRGTTVGMLLLVIAGFLEPSFIFARAWVLMAWGFSFLLVSSGRFWIRRIVYRLRQSGYFMSNAIIVGASEEGYAIAEQLENWHSSGLNVLGFVDSNLEQGVRLHGRYYNLGNLDELESLIANHGVSEIILTSSALPRVQMVQLFKRYGMDAAVQLRLSSGLFEIVTTGLQLSSVATLPLVSVHKTRLTGMDHVLKLCLDYAIAIPVLLLLLPVYVAIALAIKVDSPGSAIYRRRVMGQNGRHFDAFKFRTMRIDGDKILAANPDLKKELEETYKLKDDPRVTRVGAILRQYSLDELPQLINVLRREMSVVGPRMITPSELPQYASWDMNLLTVKPGMTGLWQVSGRSDTTYEERVRLDMRYIRTWTIWSDVYLLWLTIPAVLGKRGAY